jgi:hypothetical protein
MSPTVARYLEGLPKGIASYPEAMVKGSVLRATFADAGFTPEPGALPGELERYALDPPAIGAWVPETFHSSLVAAIFDVRFREQGGMPAFEEWAYERNRRLFRSPLYRVLFFVVRPERVFIGVQNRWAAFHRGSVLEVVAEKPIQRTVRLSHPPHLFSEHALHTFAAAFRAAGEAAGLHQVRTRCDRERPDATLYTVDWSG